MWMRQRALASQPFHEALGTHHVESRCFHSVKPTAVGGVAATLGQGPLSSRGTVAVESSALGTIVILGVVHVGLLLITRRRGRQ